MLDTSHPGQEQLPGKKANNPAPAPCQRGGTPAVVAALGIPPFASLEAHGPGNKAVSYVLVILLYTAALKRVLGWTISQASASVGHSGWGRHSLGHSVLQLSDPLRGWMGGWERVPCPDPARPGFKLLHSLGLRPGWGDRSGLGSDSRRMLSIEPGCGEWSPKRATRRTITLAGPGGWDWLWQVSVSRIPGSQDQALPIRESPPYPSRGVFLVPHEMPNS